MGWEPKDRTVPKSVSVFDEIDVGDKRVAAGRQRPGTK
jgi:hypothetical protein